MFYSPLISLIEPAYMPVRRRRRRRRPVHPVRRSYEPLNIFEQFLTFHPFVADTHCDGMCKPEEDMEELIEETYESEPEPVVPTKKFYSKTSINSQGFRKEVVVRQLGEHKQTTTTTEKDGNVETHIQYDNMNEEEVESFEDRWTSKKLIAPPVETEENPVETEETEEKEPENPTEE
ncbi:hypothetical protein PCE1_002360 [Barthelona sp. PCE]